MTEEDFVPPTTRQCNFIGLILYGLLSLFVWCFCKGDALWQMIPGVTWTIFTICGGPVWLLLGFIFGISMEDV